MKRTFLALACAGPLLAGCGEYSAVTKSGDVEYKYEVAKASYMEGRYGRSCEMLGGLLAALKGTAYGEESLYLLSMGNFKAGDYESAASFFKKYYQAYPKGRYVEQARYYSGYSLYMQTPDVRLDQGSTRSAIDEFQTFLDLYPATSLKEQTQAMIDALQDKLVEKEYLAAKLYYDLGAYIGNSTYGGSNYEACIVTSENALKDYPYASAARREELAVMLLRARYRLARESVEEKRAERYRNTIDEFYAFQGDFPESKYMGEAKGILADAERAVKRKKIDLSQED